MGSNPLTAGADLGFKLYEFVNADSLDNEQYMRAKARREQEAESAFARTLDLVEAYVEAWDRAWAYGNPNNDDRRALRHILLRLATRGNRFALDYLNAFYPLHTFMKKPVSNDPVTQSRMKQRWEKF